MGEKESRMLVFSRCLYTSAIFSATELGQGQEGGHHCCCCNPYIISPLFLVHTLADADSTPPTTHTSTTSSPDTSDDANPRASAEIGGRVPGAPPRVAAIARATRRTGSMAPPTRARRALGLYARAGGCEDAEEEPRRVTTSDARRCLITAEFSF